MQSVVRMTKPNVINSVLRDQLLALSAESLTEGRYQELMDFDLTVESIVESIATLCGVKKEISVSGGVSRAQALALEAVDGVTLPFPAQGFTLKPTGTGLRLTQESIGKTITEGLARLYELLMRLWDGIREHLFGAKARAEKAKEDLKLAKQFTQDQEHSVQLTTPQLLRAAQRVTILATHADAFKAVCKDLLSVRNAISQFPDQHFNVDEFVEYIPAARFTNMEAIGKRSSVVLYGPHEAVPALANVRKFLREVFPESTIDIPGFTKDHELFDLPRVRKYFDTFYDRSLATIGQIETTLIGLYAYSKEIKRVIETLKHRTETPGDAFAQHLSVLLKLSRVSMFLVNWLNRVLVITGEIKESGE